MNDAARATDPELDEALARAIRQLIAEAMEAGADAGAGAGTGRRRSRVGCGVRRSRDQARFRQRHGPAGGSSGRAVSRLTSGHSPVGPSASSLTMSRCPRCRAYSWSRWNRIRSRVAGGRRPTARPAGRLVKVVRGDHRRLRAACAVNAASKLIQGLIRRDVPAVLPLVAPRVGDVAALESPLKPAQLDEGEVLEQLNRGPAGRSRERRSSRRAARAASRRAGRGSSRGSGRTPRHVTPPGRSVRGTGRSWRQGYRACP